MSIDVISQGVQCCMCGLQFSRRKGFFPVSYAPNYKGMGYIPICKGCIEKIYNSYLSQCNDPKLSVHMVCRRLDLYWSERAYDAVDIKSTSKTIMTKYLSKLNIQPYIGKSYDDTRIENNSLWPLQLEEDDVEEFIEPEPPVVQDSDIDVSEDVVNFWGKGYTPEMYADLEQRRSYWMSRFPDDMELDIGTEALIRQICSLELDINRDRARGKAVDKNINALNTLLGSASLKPIRKRDEADASLDSTPMGVWAKRWEDNRPIPEDDEDENKIVKTVHTWYFGHLCKMLGIKNSYCKMYEDAIGKLSVNMPEYDDGDTDDDIIDDWLNNGGDSS